MEIADVVGKVHNIVKYLLRNHQLLEELGRILHSQAKQEDLQELWDIVDLHLIKDGGVHWNSTLAMLKRFKKLKCAVREFFADHEIDAKEESFDPRHDQLTKDDWD